MDYLNTVVNGIGIGAVLLLIALGLTLTFGQMGVINMAHGEFIMAGAYTVYLVQKIVSSTSLSLIVAVPVAFAVAGILGVVLEFLLIRHMYGRPLDTLLATWGVSLILQQAAIDIFGSQNVTVLSPTWLDGSIDIGEIAIPKARLFILLLALGSVVAVAGVLQLTPLGRRIRAVVQNRNLAECSAVPTARIDRTSFLIGSGLAGVAGVAISQIGAVGPRVGTSYIVDAFLVVVVGGIAQLKGTVIVAFALGVLQAFSEYWTTSTTAKLIVFVAIVAFLQFRPQGLFTVRTRSLA
ncbi:MAG: urea ABC transporter permease subunit UrtB [Kineosporiaceae bacterium]